MTRRLAFVALLALAIAPLSTAGQPPAGEALEREARAIDDILIAPCCFTQQVSVHQSAAADEVRRDVRTRLAAGQRRQQILDAYVAQYGKRILVEPPAAGFDLMLYVMPLVFLIASIGLVILIVRRLTGPASPRALAVNGPASPALNAEENARLDDELRDLD
jgi:cytochrome c-type biogenesis protein CcmH